MIEFFGHKGVDTAVIRAALPFHEGDEVSEGEGAKERVRESYQFTARASEDAARLAASQVVGVGTQERKSQEHRKSA